ncbi:conserved Plasmodium membrane protein, unknown function [Babesia microti strain RI]|uniref:TATA box binding protein associated factor (TAF) histone-like fold domain-containing protein n=1 Tax=Babesia microti (strain RI) TaxID=1133968 RepID=A0A1N6LXD4_BABMR|nr:conserved Plasmodium membrane protein, unknown function [Babesia microti strain RI]SIO73538.1 conserved Plasmodium membrane protein, unknown function [Babesia microti strain RI]|eukprot:XP_012649666.2 conserved Plasmodium membrane protein, unknown function [Babesia microti strain RI]
MFSRESDNVSIPSEFIISLAKTHGFMQSGKVDLQTVSARIIADTVEFRIKQIIQEASKFMYRNARTTNHMALTSDDIRCALKSLKMQDLPGYSDLCNHRYVCADKLYMGNRVIKRESKLKSTKDNWGRCKLSDIVYNDMGTLASPVPSLSVHWLSVKGTLPLVSSHFGVDVTDKLSRRAEEAVALIGDSSKMRKNENIENFSLTNNLLLKTRNNNIITRLSNAFTDSMNNSIARATNTANEPTTYIPRVEHVLEKEHHFFLNCVKNAITRAIDLGVIHTSQYKQLDKVLHILSTSLALDQLMPELSYFFATQMDIHMKNSLPHAVSIMLSFAYALISNPHAHIHFHIHQLLIPIIQVAIGKCEFPIVLIYQILRLRKKAANLVGKIAFVLRSSRNGLEFIDSQLILLLKQALSADEISIFTLYGSIACLSNMSPISRSLLLYPNFNSILSTLIYLSISTRHSLDIDNIPTQHFQHSYDEHNNIHHTLCKKDNFQLIQTKNTIYNETIQLLLGTMYYSLENDFLNMPDLFFSSSNSGYSPPFYQPNIKQLLEILSTFKLFMNGLLYDLFTPFLSAILRKFIHYFRNHSLGSLKMVYHTKYEKLDLATGHLIELTL